MALLEPGQLVPEFTLPAHTGGQISLQQFRGKKLVIYFYPADMTPTCTQEACDFRDFSSAFKEAHTEVVGISPDPLKKHDKFAEKYSLPFPLLSDEEHQVCEQFGVWQLKKMYGKEYMGVVRSTFLVDEAGKLIQAWTKVRVKNHVAEVLDAVRRHEAGKKS